MIVSGPSGWKWRLRNQRVERRDRTCGCSGKVQCLVHLGNRARDGFERSKDGRVHLVNASTFHD